MPALTKRSPKIHLEFVANKSHNMRSGLLAVEALGQQFGLWEKLHRVPRLDWRKRKSQGYSGEFNGGLHDMDESFKVLNPQPCVTAVNSIQLLRIPFLVPSNSKYAQTH